MALTLSLYRKHKSKVGKTLIVFIHGLGAPDTTWNEGNETWKDLVISDPNLFEIDVAVVKYDTAHIAMGLLNTMGINSVKVGFLRRISIGKGPFTDLKILAQELKRELNTNRSKEYEKIIIVGHSMGGLIGIRYILEEIEHGEQMNIKGFISLATPFNGSNKAFYNSLFKSIHKHIQIPSLEPNSIFLDDTIRLWQKHKEQIDFRCHFCFGTNDTWVSHESSVPHIMTSKWRDSIPLPGDHSTILKIDNHNSPAYVVVSEAIQEVIKEENQIKKKRVEILDREEALSKARCIARWQAAGLSKEKAQEIAQKVQTKFEDWSPTAERPISLLLGEFGIGKSLIADLMYQKLIEKAKLDSNCPIPIYLKASPDIASLASYVREAIEKNGDSKSDRFFIIIDGLDEVGVSIVGQILDESRAIVETWKGSRITLMSRPLPILSRLEEARYIPRLTEEESIQIISLVSEVEVSIGFRHSWPQVVKDAITRPLFAILLGLFLKDADMMVPRSKGELLTHLVEKALSRSEINNDQTKSILNRLAVLSIDRGNVPIPKSEIATGNELHSLVASGLIIESDNKISYSLPILAQWFAAQAIGDNIKDITVLKNDLQTMEYWRYPLIIFISLFSHDIVYEKFNLIVESNPAFASGIVDEGLAEWGLSIDIVPPPALQSGERIHSTMKSWVNGIGILSKLIAPIDEDNNVLPIAVKVTEDWVTSSWYNGNKKIPNINELPEEIHPLINTDKDWLGFKGARPGRQSAWAWRWSLDDLTSRLSKILQNRSLPVDQGPIFQEEIWDTALKLTKRGSYYTGEIMLEELEEIMELSFKGYDKVQIRNKAYEVSKIRRNLQSLRTQGAISLQSPWPGPDLNFNSGGWVWSPYSNDRLLERTRVVYSKAIDAYLQIVNDYFPMFKNRMGIYNTLPANLIGQLEIPPASKDYSSHPGLDWYFDPLPNGSKTSININLVLTEQVNHERVSELYDKLRLLRPKAAEWISSHHISQSLNIFGNFPVREIVYNWLWDDLKRVSWVDGTLGHRYE
ncbi:lipase/acyltransferase domain-containing protein [Paenibacillus sp. Y412MC10]|uniref:lipase/acyltransferase domain-containing protein n=1 Tax=Geobacillus sp. (strain Y412MC10) TaxID=481743 RepID=UPI0011AB7531|nr:alpha/beta hydrolase [Paenibacillus sp. Y412MC10]